MVAEDYPLGLRREALRTWRGNVARTAAELHRTGARGQVAPASSRPRHRSILNAHSDRSFATRPRRCLPIDKISGQSPAARRSARSARQGRRRARQRGLLRRPRRRRGVRRCHRVQGEGPWIGPDLSTIGTKYGKDELLRSILNPSAAIGYNFRTLMVADKDGRSTSGLLVEESPERIVLKTSEGKLFRSRRRRSKRRSQRSFSHARRPCPVDVRSRPGGPSDVPVVAQRAREHRRPIPGLGARSTKKRRALESHQARLLDLSSKIMDARRPALTWRGCRREQSKAVLDARDAPGGTALRLKPLSIWQFLSPPPPLRRESSFWRFQKGPGPWLGDRELELGDD